MRKVKDPIIALITDFGEKDFFVGSLKGVITKINPLVNIIDITHNVPSFDILTGSFMLYAAFEYFPSKTIFLIIVDPGVGSSRKIILIETKHYIFIAPDNGVLSLALEEEEIHQVRDVKNDKFFLSNHSSTFEGRDKMAPAAAWLSKGVPVEDFGPEISVFKKLDVRKPRIKKNEIVGSVLYVDKFGNITTNISSQEFEQFHIAKEAKNILFPWDIKICFKKSYSSAKKGELILIRGSSRFIEIALCQSSASEKLKVKAGDEIIIQKKK